MGRAYALPQLYAASRGSCKRRKLVKTVGEKDSRLWGQLTFRRVCGLRNGHRRVSHRTWRFDLRKTQIAKIVRQDGMSQCNRSRPIHIEAEQSADTRTRHHPRPWIRLEHPLLNRRDRSIHQQRMSGQHAIVGNLAARRNAQSYVHSTDYLRGQCQRGICGQNTFCNARPHLVRLDVLNSPAIDLRRQVSGGLGNTRDSEKSRE